MLYWGLIPSWAKEKSLGARMINARAETIAGKPSFRTAWRRRRCLVLASGYYEWQVTADGKQPHFIQRADGDPFAMAGLWESWIETPGEPALESCTIITTEAVPPLDRIHHRVPVILPTVAHTAWLDSREPDLGALQELLAPPEADMLSAVPVSRRVNSARNEGPDLVVPLGT
jgi:putative SOS response-associated peptidase YedK